MRILCVRASFPEARTETRREEIEPKRCAKRGCAAMIRNPIIVIRRPGRTSYDTAPGAWQKKGFALPAERGQSDLPPLRDRQMGPSVLSPRFIEGAGKMRSPPPDSCQRQRTRTGIPNTAPRGAYAFPCSGSPDPHSRFASLTDLRYC